MAGLPSTIGKYEVVRRLGTGAMGSVYLARDPGLDRLLAIRTFGELEADADRRARFLHEGRAVARLRHANIVTIFDVAEHEGRPYMAMEYVDGTPLSEVVRARRPIALAEKLWYLEQVCAGLHHAHSKGIVHLDVKPANLLVDRQQGVRILDFGVSRTIHGLESEGVLLGTPKYMSPEQVLGKAVDHRTDIFAVGAVAYELLTGRSAFEGPLGDVLHQVLGFDPPVPSALDPGVPRELDAIVMRALAKRPEDRFRDLEEMRLAILEVRRVLETADDDPTGVTLIRPAPSAPPDETRRGEPIPAAAAPQRPVASPSDTGSVRAPTARAPSMSPFGFGSAVRGAVDSMLRTIRRIGGKRNRAPEAPYSSGPRHTSRIVDAHFAAFAPGCVQRRKPFVLDIWAYAEALESAVWTIAIKGGEASARGTKGPVPLAVGTTLTIAVAVPGFAVDPPADSVQWNGQKANVSFLLTASDGVADGICAGTATIMTGSVPITLLHFQINVCSQSAETTRLDATERHIRSVFASYASADRAEVVQWARGAELAGVDVFLDVLKLRESVRWETELLKEVPAKDLFCLFWSEPASKSVWVEREWRCALAQRGLDYIHPVPLADPRLVPPPRELQQTQFGGPLLLVHLYEKLRKHDALS